jgi:Protein of unknown function (DUF3300)
MDRLVRPAVWTVALILVACLAVLAPVLAQDAKLKKEELDQLLAPIALYPDDLLTNVLMASTYPLDVVQAARWRKEPANAKIKGDALVKALEPKDWDPSIKALVQFPDVLETMSDKLDWTQKLGDAFLAQQDEVMGEIQFLRQKAEAAGSLESNKQQTVSTEAGAAGQEVIVIEPASPETVYVPVYEPTVVYGPWWYPDYPPYYWPYPDASYVNGFFWGTGIAIAGSIWGWNHFDWRRHDINVDVNKWNNINVNRSKITSGKWEHNAAHRGPVPYKNKEVREKYGKSERARAVSKDFRGFDTRLDKSKIGGRAAPKFQDKGRDLSKAREGAAPKAKQKASEHPRARAAKPSQGREVSRGHASRTAVHAGRPGAGQRGGVSRGGGGHHGGGGHRGGRR